MKTFWSASISCYFGNLFCSLYLIYILMSGFLLFGEANLSKDGLSEKPQLMHGSNLCMKRLIIACIIIIQLLPVICVGKKSFPYNCFSLGMNISSSEMHALSLLYSSPFTHVFARPWKGDMMGYCLACTQDLDAGCTSVLTVHISHCIQPMLCVMWDFTQVKGHSSVTCVERVSCKNQTWSFMLWEAIIIESASNWIHFFVNYIKAFCPYA